MTTSNKVSKGWTGPGNYDEVINPLDISEDGLHIDLTKKGSFEWWYFDAHFDNDYTFVIFFQAAHPNPEQRGKSGIEIIILSPEGHRIQKFFPCPKSDFQAKKDFPEVTIGNNTLRTTMQSNGLPIYTLDVEEKNLGCHLTYKSEINGWKPGIGSQKFGDLGTFAWIIPCARASVEGEIIDGSKTIKVSGMGYHDHNWLNFSFESIIKYWMWGRIYSKNYTISYAFIQCNQKVDDYQVKVLFLAEGREVILSTGDFDFTQDDYIFNSQIGYSFPKNISIKAENKLSVNMKLKRVLEAQDMLANSHPIIRFIAKYILRMRPGYLRNESNFEVDIHQNDSNTVETGSTLHEIVIFKPIQEDNK